MSLDKDEKYFHLSEIFSYYNAGTQMYLPEQAKMPNGDFRSISLAFEAAVKVAEHVSGVPLWDDNAPHRYNLWQFLDVCEDVDKEILEQLPWLADIKFPFAEFDMDTPDALKARRDWVRKVANELGSEWFALKPMKQKEQPPNGLPLRPKKNDWY